MGGQGFSPKSNAALQQERGLEEQVRRLLVNQCGVHDPHIVLVEQEPERLVALYTVQTITGRDARTAFIEPGEDDPEIVIVSGFVF